MKPFNPILKTMAVAALAGAMVVACKDDKVREESGKSSSQGTGYGSEGSGTGGTDVTSTGSGDPSVGIGDPSWDIDDTTGYGRGGTSFEDSLWGLGGTRLDTSMDQGMSRQPGQSGSVPKNRKSGSRQGRDSSWQDSLTGPGVGTGGGVYPGTGGAAPGTGGSGGAGY